MTRPLQGSPTVGTAWFGECRARIPISLRSAPTVVTRRASRRVQHNAGLARCEMGVRANVAFHTQHPPYPLDRLPGPEQVIIRFGGRELVWHPNLEPGPAGEEWWPGLTVVAENPDDYNAEAELLHRF